MSNLFRNGDRMEMEVLGDELDELKRRFESGEIDLEDALVEASLCGKWAYQLDLINAGYSDIVSELQESGKKESESE